MAHLLYFASHVFCIATARWAGAAKRNMAALPASSQWNMRQPSTRVSGKLVDRGIAGRIRRHYRSRRHEILEAEIDKHTERISYPA